MSASATPAPTPRPDRAILLPLRQRILERGLGVRAVHLHRRGHEDVEHRNVADTAENLYSVSKTVTALAVGLARAEGHLDVDDLLVDHLPAPDGGYGRGVDGIRLRHLLTMTSGSPVTAFTDDERLDPDLTARFLRTDLVSAPGETFTYSNGSTYVLARIVAERTGSEVRDYLMPRLFEPLGILNPQWFTCRGGHTWGATGLFLRTSELARIGRVLLDGGTWEGQQLVPREWIDLLHATWTPTAEGDDAPEHQRYGFQVWDCTPEGAWRADGAHGQFVVVLPRQGAVVTITSHHEGDPAEILQAVWEELLPELEVVATGTTAPSGADGAPSA